MLRGLPYRKTFTLSLVQSSETRGNGKCRRRIHITDIGQMTEGFDLAPTVIRPGAVTEKACSPYWIR